MSVKNDPRFGDPGAGWFRETTLGPATRTNAVNRTGPSLDRGGFERVRGIPSASSAGFSSLTGHRGSGASEVGFSLLQKLGKLSTRAKQGLVASLIGVTLLLPPVTGQLMHPGAPKATTSPVAMQIQEKSALPTGAKIRAEVNKTRAQIPGGTGAAREIAIRELIEVHDRAVETRHKSDKVSSSAQRMVASLEEQVGFDAKLGYAADWYWFGVPPEHAQFHGGKADAKGIEDHARGVRDAAAYARTTAREEVSNLLRAESPAYASLHAKYTHEHNRLTAAEQIRSLANDASDALSTAKHAITMRNLTPRTVEEDVYENRTTTNTDGSTSTEYVKTGTRTVDNPTWHVWNTAAVAAKARAEGKIRELNQSVKANKELLGIGGADINGNLINAWDFFGQPSFLIWSFDGADVSRTKTQADQLRGSMDGLIAEIRVVHDALERDVNTQIDSRWTEISGGTGGEKRAPEKDDSPAALRRARANRTRRDGDDGPEWGAD